MSRQAWPAAGALVAAAAAVGVPANRWRRRGVLGAAGHGGWRAVARARLTGAARWVLAVRPRPHLAAAVAAAVGLAAGGPVAAFAAAAYAGLAARALRRHTVARRHDDERLAALDALCSVAADLRAGLPPLVVYDGQPAPGMRSATTPRSEEAGASGDPAGWSAPQARRAWELGVAASRLAELTGAPLAELVERIEADARAMDRAVKVAAAQSAGARATAWLLAVLPLGGLALGYTMGVDPLHVLLRTPVGAACASAAVLLQLGGLMWADRLARMPAGAA
jgi:tight adherence protein B